MATDVPLHLAPAVAARVRAAAERQAVARFAQSASSASGAAKSEPASPVRSPPASAPADLTSVGDATAAFLAREGARPDASRPADGAHLANLLREVRELNDLEDAQASQEYAQMQAERRQATAWLPDAGPLRDLALTELEAAEAEAQTERLGRRAAQAGDPADSSTGISPALGGQWGSAGARHVLALDRLTHVVESLRAAAQHLEQEVKTAEQRLERAQELHLGLTQVAEGLEQRQTFLALKQAPPLDAKAQRSRIKRLIAATEDENGVLLQGVLLVTTIMFAKSDARRRVQLQTLLESLMNLAFERPTDPYLTIGGSRQVEEQFPKPLVLFLLRAGIAIPHPRDARRIRLARFV